VSDKVLLLGVTPELADLGTDLTAVDRNDSMVKHIWPGDHGTRRAQIGDWQNLQLGSSKFSSCIGDGSLNAVTFPEDVTRIFRGVADALQPGGRFVCRLYATPDRCEGLDDVHAAAMNGGIRSFHALKWRVAMATAAAQGNPNIPVTAILDSFERLVPDRDRLTQRCGWLREIIDTIDVYRNATDIYCFPTAAQFLSLVPPPFANPRLVNSGTYELAERCPLLVMDRA
jgi:SAM-dependent methyltransferase